jgi:hypothetical protein
MMRATGGTTTSADPSPDELNQDLRTVIVAPMTTAGRALVGWSRKASQPSSGVSRRCSE